MFLPSTLIKGNLMFGNHQLIEVRFYRPGQKGVFFYPDESIKNIKNAKQINLLIINKQKNQNYGTIRC